MSAGPTWLTPTPVGSIIVAGLQSTSPYISTFIVEIYGDVDLTQLVAQQTSTAIWDGTNSNQLDALVFSALPLGFTYWIRVGTCAANSTITSWSSPYEQSLTGNTGLDAISYGGTYTVSAAGASYLVRPSNAPSDLDHYEAIYTINNSIAPLPTITPTWPKITTDQSGLLTFGAIGVTGQVIRAYVRGVNTSGIFQSWILISTLTVSAAGGAGNLDALPDGTTYARVKASGLTAGVPDPRKTNGVLKLGSLNPAWSGSLFWSANSSSSPANSAASFWWNQLVVKRIDGTQTVIGARPPTDTIRVANLNASTSSTTVVYDFYPYIDEFLNVISFLSTGLGNPGYAWNDATLTEDIATTNSQQMNRQDRIGLGPIQISMPIFTVGGGTSGGGGGFGGTCPRGDMLVRLACGTVIRADQIKPGDKLVTTLEYGLTVNVHSVRHEPCSEWVEIHTTKGSVIVHPHTHVPVEDHEDCVQAKDLTLSHILKSRRGSARITDIKVNFDEATRVILTCDKSKVFLCGWDAPDLVIHNVRLQNC